MNFKHLAFFVSLASAASLPGQGNPQRVTPEPSPTPSWLEKLLDFFNVMSADASSQQNLVYIDHI
ncbi:hypothetical protein DSO57_1020560 [Entomophthora muscae]|uniref:Uncharacterized protein n=1 Tax=Entomophthora muscae TaxID=34485 RepID=A0ACC2T3V6_9FUNG|nr:hypothetical protein DSO57_1020560 [Entomophthora muscae]